MAIPYYYPHSRYLTSRGDPHGWRDTRRARTRRHGSAVGDRVGHCQRGAGAIVCEARLPHSDDGSSESRGEEVRLARGGREGPPVYPTPAAAHGSPLCAVT